MSLSLRAASCPTSRARLATFLLVDASARIRGAYDANDIKRLDPMIHDAQFLARTAR